MDPEKTEDYIFETSRKATGESRNLDKVAQVMELCVDRRTSNYHIYTQLAYVYITLRRKADAIRVLDVGIDSAESEEDSRKLVAIVASVQRNFRSAANLFQSVHKLTGSESYKGFEEKARAMAEKEEAKKAKEDNMPPEQRFMAANIIKIAAAPKSPSTIKNDKDKTGRNDPCSCGSGKKFKKCCGKC